MSSLICGGHTSSHQLRLGAIISAVHRQPGKHGHLQYVGGGILSGKMQYALDTIQSVSGGLNVCVCTGGAGAGGVCECKRACSAEPERGESQWDRLALGWHTVRQTHFITGLFT